MVQGLSIENWLKCDVFYFSSKWVGELRLFSKKPNTYCPKWKRSGNVPSHLKHEEKSFPNRKLSLIVHVVNVGFCVSWVLRIEHYSMHHIRLMCCKEDKVKTKWQMHFTTDFTHSPKDLWVTPWQTQVLEYTLFPSDRLLPGSHWLIFRPVSLTVTATCNWSRNKNFPIHFFPRWLPSSL